MDHVRRKIVWFVVAEWVSMLFGCDQGKGVKSVEARML